MSINRIMIKNIESQYNAEYIANYFWTNEIAKVSSITLIPYILNEKILQIAYIEIDSFCDTEAASVFIYNMTEVETYIISHAEPLEANIWVLEHNTHNEGELCVGNFTTKFQADFFQTYEDADDYLCSEEAWEYFISKLQHFLQLEFHGQKKSTVF